MFVQSCLRAFFRHNREIFQISLNPKVKSRIWHQLKTCRINFDHQELYKRHWGWCWLGALVELFFYLEIEMFALPGVLNHNIQLYLNINKHIYNYCDQNIGLKVEYHDLMVPFCQKLPELVQIMMFLFIMVCLKSQ